MTNERINQLKPLLESEQFAEEIKDMTTVEELKTAFARHGVIITEDELNELGNEFNAALTDKEEELSEKDLSNVAGGSFLAGLLIYGGAVAVSYVVGRVVGSVLKKKSGVCKR